MSTAPSSLMQDAPPVRDAALLGGLFGFLCIGAVGAVAFVGLSTVVIWLDTGLADWVVNTLCYASLILPIYLLHRRFSFRSDVPHSQGLPRYMAVQGMALLLAALFSLVAYGMLALPPVFASMLVITLTSGVNFMVLRGWAFARAQRSLPASA